MKNYALLLHLLLASATLLGMDVSVHSSFESIPSKLIGYMIQLSHNQPETPISDIVNLLNQRAVNKLFRKVIDKSAVWHDIFSHLKRKDDRIFLIRNGSLNPNNPIGRAFYRYLVSSDYYHSLLSTDLFKDIMNDDHSLALKYNMHEDNGQNKHLDIRHIASLFKACCVNKIRMSQLTDLKCYSRPIKNNNVLAWIRLILKNPYFCQQYKYTDIIADPESIEENILLPHWLLTYHLQHDPSEKGTDESDLTKACRFNDTALAHEILKNDTMQTDSLNFDTLLISIVNHNQVIFDMLIDKINRSDDENQKLIKLL